jgi:hypothetical protein
MFGEQTAARVQHHTGDLGAAKIDTDPQPGAGL